MSSEKSSRNWLGIAVTLITHCLLLAPTIYVIYLNVDFFFYTLFQWHPICICVGCGLLMAEGVLHVSGTPLFVANISKACRLKMHILFHILGVGLVLAGFGIILAYKAKYSLPNFVTDHGKLGLSAIIFIFIVGACGFVARRKSSEPEDETGNIANALHSCLGIVTMILLYASMITGLYNAIWLTYFNKTGTDLSVAAWVIGAFCVLIKPFYLSLFKIKRALKL